MLPEIRKILYATDLSENARHAFGYAVSLANRYGAGITIMHVLGDHYHARTGRRTTLRGQPGGQYAGRGAVERTPQSQ